jgi:hypothetical protein
MPGRLDRTGTVTAAPPEQLWLRRLANDLADWLTHLDAHRLTPEATQVEQPLAVWWTERLTAASPLTRPTGDATRRDGLARLSLRLPRCQLWCGWPTAWSGEVNAVFGHHWYWLTDPAGSPSDWCSLLSCLPSRQQRWEVGWQQRLWVTLRQLSRAPRVCLTAEASPAQRPILAATQRLGLPTVRLHAPPSDNQDWEEWLFERFLELASGAAGGSGEAAGSRPAARLHCFPAQHRSGDQPRDAVPSATVDPLQGVPPVDRALALLPGRVLVVAAKCGGRTWRSVQHRLACDRYPAGSTRVLSVLAESSRRLPSSERAWQRGAEQLREGGAVLWLTPIDRWRGVQARVDRQLRWADRRTCQPLLMHPPPRGDFLIHCTRSAVGPWPDQSPLSFDDHLLLSESGAGRSPLESLMRIVIQQRLLAHRQLRRGELPTVCLSAVPLEELLGRRTFQSHLGRWDWEPYGIAIRRQWVSQLGGRPVDYRPESEAVHLSPQELAFYQPNKPHWRAEREWRLIGDMRLERLPSAMAFLFVPTLAEARQLQPISHWPVWIVPPAGSKLAKN